MNTKLVLKEPRKIFSSIHDELDTLLADTFHYWPTERDFSFANFRPAIEIKQNDKKYTVKVQIPGVKKDDINVELDGNFMTIVAESKEEREEKEEDERNFKTDRSEFHYGKYVRTLSFDSPIVPEDASAKYKNGVITISVPKVKSETKKPKKLEIKE